MIALHCVWQAHLDEDTRLSPDEAAAITTAIETASKQMRSEVAWMAASERAGSLFRLPRGGGAAGDGDGGELSGAGGAAAEESPLGFEALREFTVGIQVVGSAQQDEFFAPPSSKQDGDDGDRSGDDSTVAPSQVASALPEADFVRFNAAGLQALLAEGCLYGWFLWGAEAETKELLKASQIEGADAALLVPPATRA